MQTAQAPVQILADSAHQLYIDVLHALYDGDEVSSVSDPNSIGSGWGKRDRPTKELRYATFVLENPRNRIVNASTFQIEDAIPRAVLCTLSDEICVKAVGFYNPKAYEFCDNGVTIPSNYGYRIRHLNNVNQIDEVIHLLKQDPCSRRATIHIHATGDSEIRYAPCINSLHFLIRNSALECQSFWRSENALTLLPMNIFEFTMLQELIASELGLPLGRYIHTVSSLHYYLDDQSKLEQTLDALLDCEYPKPMNEMTPFSLEQVDLLRSFEKKRRLQVENGLEEFAQLSPYWRQVANVLVHAIDKKTGASLD